VVFLGLKERGISVLYPSALLQLRITTPTINQHLPVQDALSANQLKALEDNAAEYGISHWGLGHAQMELYTW
jgi:3-isopropylmalate/(R)-2-methylmalate dehydratase large subunit